MTASADRAKSIFLQAIDRASDAERVEYLAVACQGDDELRRQVDELLRHHGDLGEFLESPGATIARPRGIEGPGTIVGPYKLLQQIGEGGMGVVFMAEQTRPVQRKVALKVIKAGMDSSAVIARFEAERQALAIMDHANIARVLDAGTTDSGLPYFVMELVTGDPITKYCDENHLSPRERLELFVPVCQAIQHAHQKGIIHRDIKPSNVMVTLYDGKPVPKVIDFGVAKATQQRLTERTLFTQYGAMVGTFEYMSPEQAEMSALGVDTRSDIYSLGVLLYELLTGTTPLTHQRLKEAALAEVLRMIKEEEPPKPSTRLIDSGETLATISAQRHMEPATLTKLVRGELDWIVMKCLEKDRNRRYETASAFAADVQRYLNDEPVQACPPSPWYRFRKFARRNKRAFVTASAVALFGLVTVVTLAVSNVRIRQEQARTNDEKERTEQAQALAEDRATEFQRGLDRLKAANVFLDRGRWYANELYWDDALAAFTKAVQLRPDHVPVWVERGDLYARLGLWDLAAADYAREMELWQPDTTLRWYQHAVLRYHLGDAVGYRQTCQRMHERFRGTMKGRFVEEMLRSSVLAPGPDADLPRVLALCQEIVVHLPRSATMLGVLGTAHYRAGQYDQAIQRLHEALTADDSHVQPLTYPVLAMAYYRQGRADEARGALERAAKILDQWTAARYASQSEDWVMHLGATAVWPVGWWHWLEYQLYFREANVLIEGAPPPADPRLHVLRARAFAGLRQPQQAAPEYDAAMNLGPQDPQMRMEAQRNRGNACVDRGQWAEAAVEFSRACALRPDDSYLWRYRAVACLAAGDVAAYRRVCTAMAERFETTTDPHTAGNVLLVCLLRDDALADKARLLALSRVADPIWHWGAWARGAALCRAGQYEESIRSFETAARIFRPRAWDWCFLAMAHGHLGHAADARRCLVEAAHWIDEANREVLDDLTGTRPAWSNWHEPVVFPLLLREAEALVSRKEK